MHSNTLLRPNELRTDRLTNEELARNFGISYNTATMPEALLGIKLGSSA